MDKKFIDLFKYGNITIPVYLLRIYSDLKIELNDFIFLMYLYNKGNDFLFNIKLISEELSMTTKEVMQEISILSDKNLLELKVVKNEKSVNEEIINLDLFYQKLSLLLIDNITDNKNEETSISCFEFIEQEFARTLNSTEYEIIKAWIESGNSEEIIKEAVKEAVFNGVNNLRYIDKILYEWSKKNIKTKDDVEKNRKKFRQIEEDKEEEKEELFDYNWFEDEDE